MKSINFIIILICAVAFIAMAETNAPPFKPAPPGTNDALAQSWNDGTNDWRLVPTNGIISTWRVEFATNPIPGAEYMMSQGGREVHVEPSIRWSNIVAVIDWKGKQFSTVIESNATRFDRAYTIESVKKYVQ